tara:strand:- start:179 stop:814 length:636 start_codon:yes stop_codon:yes gene_type:complete
MINKFKKQNYIVIKNAIEKNLAGFLYNYFLLKRQSTDTFFKARYISPKETMFGTWNDPQVPDTFSIYGDVAFETLLLKCQPIMESTTKLKLYPNYSYARIYKKGDVLERHKDRFSCEISTTLFLGGDRWPIYLEPSGKNNKKGVKVDLLPGDMLVYKGQFLEHWRDEFKGDNCAQVFLHYTDVKTKGSKENLFDGRYHIGIPKDIKAGDIK